MPLIFEATGTGATGTIQEWTAPSSGYYRITAAGAQGGGTAGGRGARISGTFALQEGDVLYIGVGQSGHPLEEGNGSGNNNASGGGGSFVRTSDADPLVVAGGGGGAMDTSYALRHGQADATVGDGTTSASNTATDGAGWDTGGSGSAQPLNDSALGCTSNTYNEGGFGGGGSTSNAGSWGRVGGGGGYVGGGGANASGDHSGGGGGSYNAGTDPDNQAGDATDGNRGDGWVEIQELIPGVPDAPPSGFTFDTTNTTTSVGWEEPSAFPEITGYTVQALDGLDVIATVQTTETTAALDGLPPDTALVVEIWATNDEGDGPALEIPLRTRPDVSVAPRPGGVFDLTWFWAPAADSYTVRLLTPAGDEFSDQTQDVTEPAATLVAPHPRSIYTAEITAHTTEEPDQVYTLTLRVYYQVPAGDAVALQISTQLTDAVLVPLEPDPDQGLRGSVEDIAGDPAAGREVRIYRRDNGELQATATTDSNGQWEWSGAIPGVEYYVVSIHLDSEAQDYAPPALNRITSVDVSG